MHANVDPAETAKFDAHAGQWWDPRGPLRTLHEINPVRLAWMAGHVRLDGARVVDVGCGGGVLSEALARAGATVTGIDLAADALVAARGHAAEHGLEIDYREVSAAALAARAPGGFDALACMELIEHVPDPAALVQACADLLRPGGWAFFSTLSRTPKAYAQAVLAAEYALRLLPRGTHDYARFLRPAELAGLCRAAGLEVVDLSGLAYNPLTHRARLRPQVDVNYLLAARKPA
ncbi:bifunctional 2-polyprenyl-6-hydroxyphenol methylase/3-demethylubiquinol 3-O-methyltransferase UbiG [Immundisolibacter cernigliae]|uniref:Ubiquinone biosynthesis O-methyltransferase n=1 Tax=Immundisolibacter cernigliae TaxID=1810504 RepID=A0A1B1YSB1_9GAMM|nr:bifunctional 2-polyprenyl-6-hydroxyphenol methylase/3-demethylubiquinol 3-O-methyltransferase UbiG [Immundisolibacter cernigliae]ANX03567.1 bifunctional 3-demethylubiquinone 3-O-methyltransferase/2-octaprenyl-6-hydroxy phenol methylase [Immundisolibacter cernigliae]